MINSPKSISLCKTGHRTFRFWDHFQEPDSNRTPLGKTLPPQFSYCAHTRNRSPLRNPPRKYPSIPCAVSCPPNDVGDTDPLPSTSSRIRNIARRHQPKPLPTFSKSHISSTPSLQLGAHGSNLFRPKAQEVDPLLAHPPPKQPNLSFR